ncbi:MAG: cupin domain-containing protein [Alkalispirochaeta sp.]
MAKTGGRSGSPITYPGEEFVLCLQGEVECIVAGRSFMLEVGDALLFDATQPHAFQNTREQETKILLVLQASGGDSRDGSKTHRDCTH